jgi:predicted transcriptional regulator
MARPSPESMSMDVFATVRKLGYSIEVLYDIDIFYREKAESMGWY